MNVHIALSFQSVTPEIKQHLAVIGKRQTDSADKSLFAAITLSSNELPLLSQYLQQAAQNVVSSIDRFVSAYTETDSEVAFDVTNTRWNDPTTPSFVEAFPRTFRKYCIMYTISEYLSMNFPELAKKYFDAAAQALQAIIQLVFFKAPPAPADASIINETTVTQALRFTPTSIGTNAYEVVVPTATILAILHRHGSLTIKIQRDVEQTDHTIVTQDTTEVELTMKKNNGNADLFGNNNTFTTPHVMQGQTAVSIETANPGENIRFRPTTSTGLKATDVFLITYTESHT